MLTYKAVFASVNVLDEDVKRATERINAIFGVKVLEATTQHILVQFDADVHHLARNPMLQHQFDILRGNVRAELELACGITIKTCNAVELSLFKKLQLSIKRLFN